MVRRRSSPSINSERMYELRGRVRHREWREDSDDSGRRRRVLPGRSGVSYYRQPAAGLSRLVTSADAKFFEGCGRLRWNSADPLIEPHSGGAPRPQNILLALLILLRGLEMFKHERRFHWALRQFGQIHPVVDGAAPGDHFQEMQVHFRDPDRKSARLNS